MVIRRIVQALLVLSCSGGLAHKEWMEISSPTSDNVATIYLDPTTYRVDKKSGLVKLRFLFDLKTVQKIFGRGFLSMRVQQQFDCKEKRMRVLDQTYFDRNMANGNVVYFDSTEGSWEPVAPETNGKFLWKTACGHVHSPLIPGNLP
jgi:hypothetical protein